MSCCVNEEEIHLSVSAIAPQGVPGGDMATFNWGRWGADDEKVAVNLIDSNCDRVGAALFRSGRIFSLALPLDAKNVPVTAGRVPPQHFMRMDGGDYAAGLKRRDGFLSTDDVISMPVQTGTNIDTLCHVADDDFLFKEYLLSSVRSAGAKKMGIEKMGALCTRGVLLDICALLGVRMLAKGTVITPAHLEACEERQGVRVTLGTVLLIRTGWLGALAELGTSEFLSGEPGIGTEAARWLAERGVPAVGCDNFAAEVIPTENGGSAPLHRMLIRGCCIYLMEMLVLDELAAAGLNEFQFIAAQLPITGATGSPLNPLAIA